MKKRTQQELDLTLLFNHRKYWTTEDDCQLQQLSHTYLDDEISRLIGRTVGSIWNRRQYLNQNNDTGGER